MSSAWVLAPLTEAAQAALAQRGRLVYESWTVTERLWEPEELAARLQAEGFTALFVEGDFVFEEALRAPSLRFVGVCRGSPRNVDLDAATEAGVVVAYTPGRNAVGVAELTVGLMLAAARGIPAADARVKAGEWEGPLDGYFGATGRELAGRTVGLLGFGAIARAVARRLRAFEMTIIAHDPFLAPGGFPPDVEAVDLPALAARSNFLSVHCPATEATEGLVNAAFLAQMPDPAYLVNTASPGVLNVADVASAVRSGKLAGVALDVHDTEPLPPRHPLAGLPNVILTPHIGGATVDVVRRHSAQILAEYERFLAGERPQHLANPTVWDRRR